MYKHWPTSSDQREIKLPKKSLNEKERKCSKVENLQDQIIKDSRKRNNRI